MRLLVLAVLLVIVIIVVVEGRRKKKPGRKPPKKLSKKPATKPSTGTGSNPIVESKPGKKPTNKPAKKPKKKPKRKPGRKPNKKPIKKPKPEIIPEELKIAHIRTSEMEKELDLLEKELDKAEANVNAMQVESRHIIEDANEFISIVDATLSGYQTKCGSQVVTGWTTNLNLYYAAGAATDSSDPFTASSGTFTAPAEGWYNICAFFRFKNSGNSNDVTILKGGSTVVAAFGNADTRDWRSTGNCVILKLTTTDTITVKHQSGDGSDCIEETGWYYSRFMAHNVAKYDA